MASRSWNRIELIGNITRDPELRYTPSGAAVCTLGLATNRTYVSEGERKEEVDFHRVVAWNKLAELCNQLLKKGTKAFISGRLQYREWETQEGQKRRDAEIVLEDMIVLSPKGNITLGDDVVEEVFAEEPKQVKVAEPPIEAKVEADKVETEEKTEKPKTAKPDEVVDESDLPF